MTKKVLYISPYFPPHRAVGTKRALAFVQGVHGSDGWEVIVLASKSVDGNDNTDLLQAVPTGVVVDYGFIGFLRPFIQWISGGANKKKPKAKPIERIEPPKDLKPSKQKGLLTPFDQYVWDTGSAIRNGSNLIKKYKPDVIWVNADPWSGFLVGNKLSKKFNIPWVADMRDPWTAFKLKFDIRPALTRSLIKRYEKRFVTSATRVVLNTEAASEEYRKIYPHEEPSKFTFIRNAYNENLISDLDSLKSNDVFTFGYYGGFRYFVPSNYILEGFAAFIRKYSLKPDQVRLEVRGGVYSDFWIQRKELGLEEFVIVEKEISADQGIALLRSWDVLLLGVINDVRLMIPSKFYDYLYSRKPVLAVSDNEELNKLIDETKSGKWVKTHNIDDIASAFASYYTAGRSSLLDNQTLIEPFGFEAQAKHFRKILDEVTSST